jgi:hypothetical protein
MPETVENASNSEETSSGVHGRDTVEFLTPDPIPRAVPWAGMSLPLRGEIQEAQLQK